MKRILKIFNFLLIIIACILSAKIYLDKSINLQITNSFYSFLTSYTKIVNNKKSVSNSLNYIKVNNYLYTNNSHSIYSPFNGNVIDVDDSSITIKCENNYILVFKDLINVNVYRYDYITSEDLLANFIDNYYMFFYKDNQKISYEEII